MPVRTLKTGTVRLIIVAAIALVHVIMLYNLSLSIRATKYAAEETAEVMKLVDAAPAPPPPEEPPEPPPQTQQLVTNTHENISQYTVGADEVSDQVVKGFRPGDVPLETDAPDFLPMSRISKVPVLPEDAIRNAIVYPPIAQRAGLEGIVYLELFVDAAGVIRNVEIIREDPADRGFGEAAVRALARVTALSPAEANGKAVAARYRYPVRFTLR
jgi:protein TonB